MKYIVIENEFQRKRTSEYKLSILVGMDSLVYSIYEEPLNRLLVLKTLDFAPVTYPSGYGQELDKMVDRGNLPDSAFRSVSIAFLYPPVSLVPSRLFNQDEKNTYLDELLNKTSDDEVLINEVKPLKLHLTYQVDKSLLDALQVRYPNVRIFHAATPFLMGCHHSIPQGVVDAAFTCFQNNAFQLALFSQGQLLLYNCFSCKTASDILYFILLAFEQYDFNPNEVPLFLSGHVIHDSDIYNTLYRYIAHLSFLPFPSFVNRGKIASSMDTDFFFPLHSLLLCK